MGSIVEHAPPESHEYIQQFFPSVVEAFETTFLGTSTMTDKEMRLAYQGYLATLISCFLAQGKIPIDHAKAEHLFKLLIQSFHERGSNYEEGIIACSTIALNLGPAFLPFTEEFCSFLDYGIANWQDASICKVCVISVSDLIRSLGDDFEPYLEKMIDKIFSILEVLNTNLE
jgi:hypothetical protein